MQIFTVNKVFIVHNNYLKLIKVFTVNKIFAINNYYLPLIKLFSINRNSNCEELFSFLRFFFSNSNNNFLFLFPEFGGLFYNS